MSGRVVHFEVPFDDGDRARSFYKEAFGWQVMFVIGAVPGLLIAGLLLTLSESPRWLIGRGRLAEAEAIIKTIEASSTEPLDAVTEGADDVADGAACRANAVVRSVPGRLVGCRRPVGRSGAYWRKYGLDAAWVARSSGRFSPVSSALK